jgi:hypothetical protein
MLHILTESFRAVLWSGAGTLLWAGTVLDQCVRFPVVTLQNVLQHSEPANVYFTMSKAHQYSHSSTGTMVKYWLAAMTSCNP